MIKILKGKIVKIDISDGFFDSANGIFIRPKPIETPAILTDVLNNFFIDEMNKIFGKF